MHRTLELGVRVVPRWYAMPLPGSLSRAYPCSRSRRSSVTLPQAATHRRCSATEIIRSPGRGKGPRSSQRATNSAHSDGTCDSTPMRARTSSPRLVSWVVNVVIACGHSRARVAARLVKLRRADTEPLRLAADFVKRDQAGVAVEQAILDGLGGHCAAQLLQPGVGFAAGGKAAAITCKGTSQFRRGSFGFGQRIRHQRRKPSVVAAVDVDVTEQCGHRRRAVADGRRRSSRRCSVGAWPARCPACRWPRSALRSASMAGVAW